MSDLASDKQKDFIRKLCANLGYDSEDYLYDDYMTKVTASKLITELMREWE